MTGEPLNPTTLIVGSAAVSSANAMPVRIVGSVGATNLIVGSSTITSGTTTRVLFDNAGVLGEYTVTGTGSVMMNTTTSNGAASTPALRMNGTWFSGGSATTTTPQLLLEPSGTTSTAWSSAGTAIGGNAASGFGGTLLDLKVNNASHLVYDVTDQSLKAAWSGSGFGGMVRFNGIFATGTGYLGFSSTGSADGSPDIYIGRRGAASLLFGGADSTAPTAQTLSVSGATGIADTAGALWTNATSQGTGTGVGGDYLIQVAPAGSTSSTPNTLIDGLRVKGNKSVIVGSGALATNATDGFLYITTCAGTPVGSATVQTGRIAMQYDSSGHRPLFYDGAAWTAVAMATNPTISSLVVTGTLTYGGVTFASTVTGTGSLTGATNPTLSSLIATGTLTYGGVAFASTVTGTGSLVGATNPTLSSLIATGTLTYGGVTLASTVTGTGSMVLSAAPALTGNTTLVSAAATGILTTQNAVAASASVVSTALLWSSTASFGIVWGAVGSVVPTIAATQGCLFINTSGSSVSTRMYVRSSASTWISFTTAG